MNSQIEKFEMNFFKPFLLLIAVSVGCSAATNPAGSAPARFSVKNQKSQKNVTLSKTKAVLPQAVVKDLDAKPVIMIEDFTNFDGFIAMTLLQKDPSIDLRLVVANNGFGNVAPS